MPNLQNGKTEIMTDMDKRIIHMESRVDNLERTVSEIKDGVATLLKRPTSPGFGQFMGVVLTVLATTAIVFGFAEWRLSQATGPVSIHVGKVEQYIEKIEKRLELSEDQIIQGRINRAVLEERLKWVDVKSGWNATIDKKN